MRTAGDIVAAMVESSGASGVVNAMVAVLRGETSLPWAPHFRRTDRAAANAQFSGRSTLLPEYSVPLLPEYLSCPSTGQLG